MIMPANGIGGQIRELNICREFDVGHNRVGQCKEAELLSDNAVACTSRRHFMAKHLIGCGSRICHVEDTSCALSYKILTDLNYGIVHRPTLACALLNSC
jgi:hypothetical protein